MDTTTVATLVGAVATTTKCTKHLHMNNNSSSAVDHSSHVGHGADGGMHDMMMMFFHFGYTETILFEFWKTDSISIFLISCLILFILAALYEGLKLIREKLIRDEIIHNQQIDVIRANTITSACHCNVHDSNKSGEQRALLSASTSAAPNGKAAGEVTDVHASGGDDAVVTVVSTSPHECCHKKLNQGVTSTRIATAADDDESKLIVMKNYRARLLSRGHLIQTFLHMLQITVSYLLMLVFMTYNTWLCLSVVLGAGFGYFLFGLKRLTDRKSVV